MITLRRSAERHRLQRGIHDTWMTFDPGNPLDPLRRGFHALETLNEENLGPEGSLQPHVLNDAEVITYVREGSLIHQDAGGRLGRLGPGEFQRTSARRGIRHRAVNGSLVDDAHVFQFCITPRGVGLQPAQEQRHFPLADREGVLRVVVSPDGGKESLSIDQNLRLYSSILLLGHHLIHELGGGRRAWLHVVQGRVMLRDHDLRTGDGAALDDEGAISFTARESAEILLFDLA